MPVGRPAGQPAGLRVLEHVDIGVVVVVLGLQDLGDGAREAAPQRQRQLLGGKRSGTSALMVLLRDRLPSSVEVVLLRDTSSKIAKQTCPSRGRPSAPSAPSATAQIRHKKTNI